MPSYNAEAWVDTEWFFLPISSPTASRFTAGSTVDESALVDLTYPELAALIALQAMASSDLRSAGVCAERTIMQAIRMHLWASDDPSDTTVLRRSIMDYGDVDQMRDAVRHMQDARVSMLSEHAVLEREYLDQAGNWDPNYRHRVAAAQSSTPYVRNLPRSGAVRMSDAQMRAMLECEGDPDEPIHVQGYAGVGKTRMLSMLVEYLDRMDTMVIGLTWEQVNAMQMRAGGIKYSFTFAGLARWMMEKDRTQSTSRKRYLERTRNNYTMADDEIADKLELPQLGRMPPQMVARIVRRTVSSYCYSSDSSITSAHLPDVYTTGLRVDERAAMVAYAERYWSVAIDPGSYYGICVPVRGYHLVKHLSVSGAVIPAIASTILIDEAHDLSPPMIDLLSRSEPRVITMGDDYQRFGAAPVRIPEKVRQREITQSMRHSAQIEPICNAVIERHPSRFKGEFSGSRNSSMMVDVYHRRHIPSGEYTIVVNDIWELVEWVQRLVSAGARFALLPGLAKKMRVFVQDIYELYHHHVRPRHPLLVQYSTWNEVRTALSGNRAFAMVDRMLDHGYSRNNLADTLSALEKFENAPITIGIVDAVRNIEYRNVMVTSGFTPSTDSSDMSNTLSRLYVASTRAYGRLLVPASVYDWATK